MNHRPQPLQADLCTCGRPVDECLIDRAASAPPELGRAMLDQHARGMQQARRRWWMRGAR